MNEIGVKERSLEVETSLERLILTFIQFDFCLSANALEFAVRLMIKNQNHSNFSLN